jgi:hypothetical protein
MELTFGGPLEHEFSGLAWLSKSLDKRGIERPSRFHERKQRGCLYASQIQTLTGTPDMEKCSSRWLDEQPFRV